MPAQWFIASMTKSRLRASKGESGQNEGPGGVLTTSPIKLGFLLPGIEALIAAERGRDHPMFSPASCLGTNPP